MTPGTLVLFGVIAGFVAAVLGVVGIIIHEMKLREYGHAAAMFAGLISLGPILAAQIWWVALWVSK